MQTDMADRFDPAAQRVMEVAEQEARLRSVGMNTPFVLFALLEASPRMFTILGDKAEQLKTAVTTEIGPAPEGEPVARQSAGAWQFRSESQPGRYVGEPSPAVEQTLHVASGLAAADNREKIATRDLLLALIESQGVCGELLNKFKMTREVALQAFDLMISFEDICYKVCRDAGLQLDVRTLARVVSKSDQLQAQLLVFLREVAAAESKS